MNKNIIKFDNTEIEEHKFHQNKSPISINSLDINKIIGSNNNNFLMVNKILNNLLPIKLLKKLDLYAYSVQKCKYI